MSLLLEETAARSVVFSPDGRTLAVSTLVFPSTYPKSVEDRGSRQRRCEVQLWDIASRERFRSLVVSEHDVPRVAFDPEIEFSRDGQKLRFQGTDTTTRDVPSATPLSSLSPGQEDSRRDAFPAMPLPLSLQMQQNQRGEAFSGDGKWGATTFLCPGTGFSGEFVQLWKRGSNHAFWQKAKTIPAATFSNEIVDDITWNSDGSLLAVFSHDQQLRLFHTAPLRLWKKLSSPEFTPRLVFSPDDRFLLGCGWEASGWGQRGGCLLFWNTNTWQVEQRIASSGPLLNPVFSPDGQHVAAIEGEASVFFCSPPFLVPSR